MSMESLHDLLKHELGDLLFAEKTILKALPKMAREVTDGDVRSRMEAHVEETRGQVTNLQSAFEAMGERAKAEKCPAILGLVEEHDEFKSEEEPTKPILTAFDLGSGLRVEHYEIAAYKTSIALARALGYDAVIRLLEQNLDQELAMAEFLEGNAAAALSAVGSEAAAVAERNARRAERGASKSASKRGGSKRASKQASKRGAAKRGSAKKATKKAAAKRGSSKRRSR